MDCCITKAPRGGEKAGSSPVDRGKRGLKRSMAVDANGIPLSTISAPANRHDSRFWSHPKAAAEALGGCRSGRAYTLTAATTRLSEPRASRGAGAWVGDLRER